MSRWHNPGGWRVSFLVALRDGKQVSVAAQMAGITKEAAYSARKKDKDFGVAWNDARAAGWHICRQCGASEVYITSAGRRQCRVCERARRRQYKARNPARFTTEARRVEARSYYERNREKINRDSATWRQRNPERRREVVRRYDSKPEVRLRRRRAGRRSVEYMAVLVCDPCSYCGATSQHIDHIQPVSHGGVHDWTNLTAACRFCNVHKLDNSLLGFLANVPIRRVLQAVK